MNRCNSLFFVFLRARTGALALVLAALAAVAGLANPDSAQAQVVNLVPRQFPAGVNRGTMVVTLAPTITMDAQADRLSPGARIRDTSNLLVLSSTLAGQSLLVNYLRDTSGMVKDVWILTPTEAALPLPSHP